MSEIYDWSDTDAGNNLTPPDGWPEGMQPSGVNDVGRMMMGSLKRFYNSVTTSLAGKLSLAGGTLTGNLTAPGLISTGTISAASDISGRDLYGRNFTATGIVSGAAISVPGNITTTADIHGNDIYGRNFNATGTLSAAAISMTGNITTTADIHGNDIYGRNFNATGALTAASATISNLTVPGTINTTSYQLSGQPFATRGTDAGGPVQSVFDVGGLPAIDMYGVGGTYYRCDNAHTFTNRAATVNIVRFQTTDGVCQNATGSWSTFSDRALKENFAPYTAGLTEVLQLNPQSFTYIAGKNPFDIGAGTYYGLVAQDVEPILPEMVGHDDDGTALLQPTHLVYVLLNAVKELEARLAQVENRGG